MSRQVRQRRRRHNRGGAPRILLISIAVAATTVLVAATVAVAYAVSVLHSTAPIQDRHPVTAGSSSQLLAANGTRLGFIHSNELRSPISWSKMPGDLKNATIAIEDQRFYTEDAIDLTGILRSAVKDVTNGAALQGASTITMQLIRNLYIGDYQHTIKQKLIEAKLAIEYAKHHSKRSILTTYLNSVPYGTVEGQTAIGVQAAARTFFDEPASKLTLTQAALIAGLPQAPSEYNPFIYPAAARERRNEVLGKMAQLHYITQAQAARSEAAPLGVHQGDYYSQRRENFFFEYVREQLIAHYGAATVEQGGLKVYTTINLNSQRLARQAIAEHLDEPGDPAAAIVTINPTNGYIETMAESEKYGQSQFNLAADGYRQPGSTFKAIDLAEALSRGVDPETTQYISHTLPAGWLPSDPTYSVHTFEETSLNRPINLVQATLTSDNTVFAQLAADLGEKTITEMAHKMGVTAAADLQSYPPEAIGGLGKGVTPLEMANVYATLADGGYRNTPIAITKVVFPDGQVDTSWGTPHRVKVLSTGVTSEETKILEENVQSGTATNSAISCPTAAKTGTTSSLVDAWLDGYTGNYATAVWMGYPNKDIPMTDVNGEEQQGAYLPAEIWHSYMEPVVDGHCVPFPADTEPITYVPFHGHYASLATSTTLDQTPTEATIPVTPQTTVTTPATPPVTTTQQEQTGGAGVIPGKEAPATTPEAPTEGATGTPSTPATESPANGNQEAQGGGVPQAPATPSLPATGGGVAAP